MPPLVALPAALKGIPSTALYTLSGGNGFLYGNLIRSAFFKYAATTGIKTFGVLSNNDKINVLGPLILKGGVHAGEELHRPKGSRGNKFTNSKGMISISWWFDTNA